jgi:hypothetical protein
MASVKHALNPTVPITNLYDPHTSEYRRDEHAAEFAAASFDSFGCPEAADIPQALKWVEPTPTLQTPPSPITPTEFNSVLHSYTTKSSSGPDQVPPWLLKFLPPPVHTFLRHVCTWLLTNPLPRYADRSWVVWLYKGQNDPSLITSFRPISLTTFIYRLQSKILFHRLREETQTLDARHPHQGAAFRANPLHQVMTLLAQCSGGRNSTLILFDFLKAYDSVDRHLLWQLLARKGFSPSLISAIQNLYTRHSHQTIAGPYRSTWHTDANHKGLRQGCSLRRSPL